MSEQGVDPKKVRYISLVRREGGEPVLGIPYQEMSVDPDLVASFVLAIVIFENRQLKTFAKEGYVVILEEGNHVLGLLIVDKVDSETPYRDALKSIIDKFETDYKSNFENWRGDIRPFREFALSILCSIPYESVDVTLVPRLVRKAGKTGGDRMTIPWSVGETDIKLQALVGFVNGKRTIEEIIQASGFPRNESLAIFSMLTHFNWVKMSRRLMDESVLKKVAEPSEVLLGVYGEPLTKILSLCDGQKTLAQVCQQLPYSIEVVKTVVQTLVDAGAIEFSSQTVRREGQQ